MPKGKFLFGTGLYYLCYLIPLLLLLAVIVINRQRAIDNANVSKVRTKNANKVAVKRLKIADKLLKESKQEAFYEEVLKALWGYISDKMNIPVANLSKDSVEQQLIQHGVDKELSDKFLHLLNECEFARYAPSSIAGGMENIYASAIEVISQMENSIKRMKKN